MIILHILVAVLSFLTISAALLRPAKKVFMASYSLVGGTVATGLLLVLQTPTHMTQVCISGLTYVAIASLTLTAAHVRFARLVTKTRQ